MRTIHLHTLALSFVLLCGPGNSLCHAVSYRVTLHTTPLANHTRLLATRPTPPAPFSLASQFDDGLGLVNNAVPLSHLNFGSGGGPLGSPFTSPGASGSLAGIVTLTDRSPFLTKFHHEFTPRATGPLGFLPGSTVGNNFSSFTDRSLFLTNFRHVFTPRATGPLGFLPGSTVGNNLNPLTPDESSFGIGDSVDTGTPPPPILISGAGLPLGCPTCPTLNLGPPAVDFAATPEPGSWVLMLSGLLICIAVPRRRIGGGFRSP